MRGRVWIFVAAGLGGLAVAVLIVLAVTTDQYRIPTEAMKPTLDLGDRILVKRVGGYDPERGVVVVFKPPAGAATAECGEPRDDAAQSPCARPTPGELDEKFVQRIVGLPGERVAVEDGRAVVDGRRLDEDYIARDEDCLGCDLPEAITVPPDHVFLMVDNRGLAADSRNFGPVPEDSVVGEVSLRYWPPGSFGKP